VWGLRPVALSNPSINFRFVNGRNKIALDRPGSADDFSRKVGAGKIVNLPGICDDPGDKYEQAIQGLFTAGTSGFRDSQTPMNVEGRRRKTKRKGRLQTRD